MKKLMTRLFVMRLILFTFTAFLFAFTTLASAGCGGSGDDDDDCAVTETCSIGPDAGATADDADPSDSDANAASDANDPCAEYTNVPRDNWSCDLNGGLRFYASINFVAYGDNCVIHTAQFWCDEDIPPASSMLTGAFTCTDINQDTATCYR